MPSFPRKLRRFRGFRFGPATTTSLGLVLVLLLSSSGAALTPGSPEGGGPPGAGPRSSWDWGNTSIETTDPRVANNTDLNFTFSLEPGSMSADKNLTVLMSEVMGTVGVVRFGLTALEYDGPTGVNPVLILPNGTWIDGPITFLSTPQSGILSPGLEWSHGWWWSATWGGAVWAGPLPWENGTYLMNTSEARAVLTQGGLVVSGPSLTFEEGGNPLPLPLFIFALPDVFWVQNGSAVILPDNGELLAASPSFYTVPFTGHNQSSSVPPDEVFSPGLAQTSENEATLWGNFSHHAALPTDLVGDYTEDSAFGSNDTVGISATCWIPPPLLPGQVAVEEVSLPFNASTTIDIGFSSLTFLQVPLTIPEVGVFTDYGKDHAIYLDLADAEESGDDDNIILQDAHGPWWSVSVTGTFGLEAFEALTGVGGSSTTNGTFDLGSSTAWGVSDRPFFSNGSFSTQPTFFFSGNVTPISVQASYELDSLSTGWVPPSSTVAWSLGKDLEDVLMGPQQNRTLPPSWVAVTNATYSDPYTLENGTVLWSQAPAAQGRVFPGTLPTGGNGTVVVWLNGTTAPTPQESVTATSSLGAKVSAFQYSSEEGAFEATYAAPAVLSPATDTVTFSVSLYGLEFPLVGSTTVDVLPQPELRLLAGFTSGAVSAKANLGEQVEVFLNVTTTLGVPVLGARLSLAVNTSGGAWGPVISRGGGEYQVAYTAPDEAGLELLQFVGYATGSLPSLPASLHLAVQRASAPSSTTPTTSAAPPSLLGLEGLSGVCAVLVVAFVALSLPRLRPGERSPPRPRGAARPTAPRARVSP